MAVLHITYQRTANSSDADCEGFYNVLNSYHCVRLSQSNWAIYTEEPPKAVWQKLTGYIDPDEYLVMMPLDAISWSMRDAMALEWILACP